MPRRWPKPDRFLKPGDLPATRRVWIVSPDIEYYKGPEPVIECWRLARLCGIKRRTCYLAARKRGFRWLYVRAIRPSFPPTRVLTQSDAKAFLAQMLVRPIWGAQMRRRLHEKEAQDRPHREEQAKRQQVSHDIRTELRALDAAWRKQRFDIIASKTRGGAS